MNYLAHAKAAEPLGELGVLGSQLPDIRYNGLGNLHRNATQFLEFARQNEKHAPYVLLAAGTVSHQTVDRLTNSSPYFQGIKVWLRDYIRRTVQMHRHYMTAAPEMIMEIGVDSLLLAEETGLAQRTARAWRLLEQEGVVLLLAEFLKFPGEDGTAARISEYAANIGRIFERYATDQGCAEAFVMRMERLMIQNGMQPQQPHTEQIAAAFKEAKKIMLQTGYMQELEGIITGARENSQLSQFLSE